MADHAQKQIRDAIVTLITGLDSIGANVSGVSYYPSDVLPWAIVWALEENVLAERSPIGQKIRREAIITIEGRFKPLEGQGDALDITFPFRAEVEAALCADPTMGQKAQDVELTHTSTELSGSEERPIAVVKMEWRVVYYTTAKDPTVILPS